MAKIRVLLAEDQPVNARVMEAQLAGDDYEVDIAADGERAVALAEANDYSVILMDLDMPKMGGLDATRAIRNLPAPMRTVPIIALTAEDDPAVQRDCLAAGMNSFLAKPVPREALHRMIEQTIRAAAKRTG